MDLFGIIEGVVVLLAVLASSQHYIHMLQLESYQQPGYRGYLSRTRDQYIMRYVLPGFLAMVCCFVTELFAKGTAANTVNWVVLALFAVYAALRTVLDLKTPAKKPLVYTKRVWRLEGILFALTLVVTAFLAFINFPAYVLYAGCPFVVYAASLLAQPIEKKVNAGFFNKAEKKLRERDDLIKIGITGSYGKTSTKFALKEILSVRYRVLATPASFNTPMGLSRVINEQLSNEHQVFLAEMGARHVGDIQELCDLVHPTYGVITSVGPQHLDTFGTIEKVADTKFELIENLPENGIAFFSTGSLMIERLYARCAREKYRTTSDDKKAAYMAAHDIQAGRSGSTFTLVCDDGESVRCRTTLLGRHNIDDIVLAAAVARKLGLTMEEIARGIRRILPVEHRLQLMGGAGTVIDDSFNSNPSGSAEALNVLASFQGRKIIVTPGMVEQGEKEDEINFTFGTQMPGKVDIAILVGPKHTLPIRKGLLSKGFAAGSIYTVKDLSEASQVLASIHTDLDVVLFENDLPDNYNE